MKKVIWKQILGLAMAVMLVLTGCPTAFPGNGTVQAAEGNLITDESFQDPAAWAVVGDTGDNGEIYADYSYEGGKAVFVMKAFGSAFWQPCIKTAEPIALEADSVYRAQFTVESTIPRTVHGGFDNGHHFSEEVALNQEGDSYKATVTYDYTVGNGEENYFIVCLGGGMAQESFVEHTVKVSEVSVIRIGDKPEDPDLGPLPEAEQDIPAVENNLLTNGNLADVNPEDGTAAGWILNSYLTGAEVSTEPYRVNYNITGAQADYQVNMNQTFQAEYKAEYQISFDVETTLDRTVTYGIEKNGGRIFTETSATIPAGEKTTVTASYQSDSQGTQTFMIYLGGEYQKHKVGISNISIVKTKEGEEKGYEAIPGFEEPAATEPVEGNLLPNGNFAGDFSENWVSQQPDNLINDKNRVDIKVTNTDSLYWGAGGLKTTQPITLKKGNTYRIRYTAVATIDRSVYADLDINGAPKYFGEGIDLKANIPGTFDREVTMEEDLSGPFAIWFGGPTELETPHYIGISDVSIVLTKEGESGGEEGGDTPAPDQNPLPEAQPTAEAEGNILTNGNFADGLTGWRTAGFDPIATANRVDFHVVANGLDWNPSLIANAVTLEPNSEYTIRFHAYSTVARTIGIRQESGTSQLQAQSTAIEANKDEPVEFTYTTGEEAESLELMICVGAGFTEQEVEEGKFQSHYVGISQVSMVKTGGAAAIQYGDMNGDHKVTAVDALILLNKALDHVALPEEDFARADANKDGQVTIQDVTAVLQLAAAGQTY